MVHLTIREQTPDLPPNLSSIDSRAISVDSWLKARREERAPVAGRILLDGRGVRPSLLLRALKRLRGAWDGFALLLIDTDALASWQSAEALGASDFVTPSTPQAEVLARMVSRNFSVPVAERDKQLHIDWRRLELIAGPTHIRLTLREMQLVDVLMKTDEPMVAADLARAAWGANASPYAASTHICAIRKKLAWFGGDCGIRTIQGKGYVFLNLKGARPVR